MSESISLPAVFRARVGPYDLSNSLGIGFYWKGSGGLDQLVDFQMESPTGGWLGHFYDGPEEWRWIFLSWDDLVEYGLNGSRPNKSIVIGIYWIYHSPGVRGLDYIVGWYGGDVKATFIIRKENQIGLLGTFTVRHSSEEDVLASFEVSPD